MYIIVLAFIALAVVLVWYLLRHDHGRQLPVGSLWMAFGFGILGTILAGLIEAKLLPSQLIITPYAFTLSKKILLFIEVGFIEEAAKFIPLALFIYHKNYFREHTDGVIYFAICGLTFGMSENILYTLTYGSKVGITRLILTPFFHASCTSILGYYLVSSKIKSSSKPKLILAVIIVPLLHGIYDFGLGSGIGQLEVLALMITLLLTMGLFLYFMQANDLDKAVLATATPSSQNFCSNCGRPNIRHTQFCEYCGHRL